MSVNTTRLSFIGLLSSVVLVVAVAAGHSAPAANPVAGSPVAGNPGEELVSEPNQVGSKNSD